MSASAARTDAMLRGQSTLAQKVYGVMPEVGVLDLGAIKRALETSGQIGSIEQPKLLACLNSLKDAKLITEPKTGEYKRRGKPGRKPAAQEPTEPEPVAVIETQPEAPAPVVEPVKVEEPAVQEPEPAPVVAEAPAPVVAEAFIPAPAQAIVPVEVKVQNATLDMFSELSNEVVKMAVEFNARLRDLAVRIEEAALLVEDHAEDAEKFRKLKDFMGKL